MENKYKKITIAGSIITICIIFVLFLVIINKKNNGYIGSDDEKYANADTEREYYIKDKVKNATTFFTVQNCIQKFINYTYDNEDYIFKAKEMNESVGERISQYAVGGTIYIGENRQNIFFKVNLDYFNMTYEVIPYRDYNSIDEITFENKEESVEKKDNNTFEYTRVTEKELCQRYYEDFIKLEMENPEEAYSLIEEEYRKQRFPTIQDYLEYVNDSKNMIELGLLRKYLYEEKEDYVECTLSDSYDNIFTVYATNVMNYKIRLDNYTIKADTKNEEYNKMNERNKVSVNCYHFIQMINTKDYAHAYECLDDTFKQNNFNNLDSFKEYVRNNFFEYNVIQESFKIEKDKDKDYYVSRFNVYNNNPNESAYRDISVIMKLKDDTDFVMSFSFE